MRRGGLTAAIAVVLGCAVGAAQSGGNTQQGGDAPGTATQSGRGSQSGGRTEAGERTQPSGTQTGTATRGSNQSQTVTVRGCLQSDQVSAGNTSSPASADAARGGKPSGGGMYMLTNARMTVGAGGQPGTNVSEATGRGTGNGNAAARDDAAARGPAGGTTFMLQGNNLGQHVGHEVEVTGRMIALNGATSSGANRPAGTSGSSSRQADGNSTSAGATSTSRPGDSVSTPGAGNRSENTSGSVEGGTRLQVTAVRTLSNTCTTQ